MFIKLQKINLWKASSNRPYVETTMTRRLGGGFGWDGFFLGWGELGFKTEKRLGGCGHWEEIESD